MFRPALRQAVPRSDGSKGGRPPFDHVLMFKVLILQSMHALSDERCEYLIKDRLSFMRFLGLGLADPVPDANTIWTFREARTRAMIESEPAVTHLFKRFDAAVKASGYLAMGGQIVDATIVAAPKQRNTLAEKAAIKEGRIPEDWKDKPAKLAQKDRDARWSIKYTKAKPREDGAKMVDIAIPSFGYKNHIGIDRRHGLIRTWTVTNAAAHDGAGLPALLDRKNTASDVWAKLARGHAKRSLVGWLRRGTRPIDRKRTKRISPIVGSSRASTSRSRKASRCPMRPGSPTVASRRCDRLSNTSSPTRRV